MVTQTGEGLVEFRFYAPHVRQLALVGEFNNWQETGWCLTREKNGWWRCQVQIKPGTYEFRYQGDGQWFTDYASFGLAPGPLGTNSVLLVEPARKIMRMEDKPSRSTAGKDAKELQAA